MSDNKSPILKLSVSKTKTYESCAKKYNYAYNLKLPQKDMDYHIFGKMLHLCLELFYGEYVNGSEEPFHVVMNRSFKEAKKKYGEQMTKDAKKEALDIMVQFMHRLMKDPLSIKRVLSVEKNFKFNISDNVILNGMIDRIDLDEDGVYNVIDYKTTKNKKYLKNDFMQLLTYAYVIHNEDPTIKKIRGTYVLLRHDFECMTKEFDIEEVLEIKAKYETCAKEIEDERLWRANPTRLCSWCSYIDICSEGKKTLGSGSWSPVKQATGKMQW